MDAHRLVWLYSDGTTVSLLPCFGRNSQEKHCSSAMDCSRDQFAKHYGSFHLDGFLGHRKHLIADLHRCVLDSGDKMEGNCLCTLEQVSDGRENAQAIPTAQFILNRGRKTTVRNNLFVLGRRCRTILEIGFNAGHSAALLLFARDVAADDEAYCQRSHEGLSQQRVYLGVDTCEHKYTSGCFELLRKEYAGEVDMHLREGDSRAVLPTCCFADICSRFDLIHIDGGHSSRVAHADIVNCKRFATTDTLVCIDDSQLKDVKKLLAEFTRIGFLKEVNYALLDLTKTPVHRVFYYGFD